jgi:hypothetical protein
VIASPRICRLLERLADLGLPGLLVTEPANLQFLLERPEVMRGAFLVCADRRVAVVNTDGGMPGPFGLGGQLSEPADLLSAVRALDYCTGTVGYDSNHLSVGDVAALQDVVGERVTLRPAPGIVEELSRPSR